MADALIDSTKDKMEKVIAGFSKQLSTVRTGNVGVNALDGIKVPYYGFLTPLNQMANLSLEGRTIIITPFEGEYLKATEKAINDAHIGLTAYIYDKSIKVSIPAMDKERRTELTKLVSKYIEDFKVSIRVIRRDMIEPLKKDKQVSEDQRKRWEKQIQDLTETYNKKIDEMAKKKQEELMKI
jgi:ribosome recycling factor